MRDIGSTFLACIACLSLVVLGDSSSSSHRSISTASPSVASKSVAANLFGLAVSTNTITASIKPPISSSLSSPPEASTTVLIDISSFLKSANSSEPSTSRAVTTSESALQVSNIPMSSSSTTAPSEDNSSSHQTLVIVLAAVLGAVGLILIGAIVFLIYRYRRGRLPFGHRGVSPINDDEIASWRRTGQEQKLTLPSPVYRPAIREVTSVHLNSPGWTWTASPSSIRTVSAHITDHQVQAQAPNARAGLTDEVVPGADPFIPQPKRQNSRLSKLPPGHARSKSRRSSMSAKSLWSPDRTSNDLKYQEQPPSTWYAVDDAATSPFRTELSTSSPGTSVFGEAFTGGLSPRPERRTRPWEQEVSRDDIGRAIA
ncbi:hypothetical protein ONS95_000785 [Cadophora gregata]|uniref:uncharacterized protein n=1 Tax=Cadophora gregata TaxID=51156 RepID=UPI0026DD6C90|nr:uncharacterized protein ONS95_000785 [Cadophora gregata]KAK0128836.1 hypothetical protein ONS95_000785 [Cadophora gregata]